jgi:hypothetical protein
MLGVETGKWNVYDGKQWIETNPLPVLPPQPAAPARVPDLPSSGPTITPRPAIGAPPPVIVVQSPPSQSPVIIQSPTYAPAQKESKSGGCGCSGCGIGCLAIVVLLGLGLAGSYLALRNGMINTSDILALVGIGPGYVEVDNYRNERIQAQFTPLEGTESSMPSTRALKLSPYDIMTFLTRNPGRYRVMFASASGASLGSCALTIRSGDRYQFVALPERVVVNRRNAPSSLPADLLLETSAFCR